MLKKNEEGSALVWAIAVVMVLSISIAAGLSISSAYYKRAMQSNDERQAYLTSKGVIEDIVDKIILNDPQYLDLFKDLEVYEKTYLSIPLDSSLGQVSSTESFIECLPVGITKGRITVSITTKVADSSYTVNADLGKGRVGTADKWQLERYYQGEPPDGPLNNVETGSQLLKEIKTFGTCWNNNQVDSVTRKCLSDEMKKDTEGYANLIKKVPDFEPVWKNNDKIRTYLYHRENPSGWPVFDKEEITNKELGAKLKESDYYIQTYIAKDQFSLFFVFAKPYSSNALTQGWNNATLFYNAGHWYYVDHVEYGKFINGNTGTTKPGEGVMITAFETKTDAPLDNSDVLKWSRFVKAYLTPENLIQ